MTRNRLTRMVNRIRWGTPTRPPYRPPLPPPMVVTRHTRPQPYHPHHVARVSPLTGIVGAWWTGKDRDKWATTPTRAAVFDTEQDARKAMREHMVDVYYTDASPTPAVHH